MTLVRPPHLITPHHCPTKLQPPNTTHLCSYAFISYPARLTVPHKPQKLAMHPSIHHLSPSATPVYTQQPTYYAATLSSHPCTHRNCQPARSNCSRAPQKPPTRLSNCPCTLGIYQRTSRFMASTNAPPGSATADTPSATTHAPQPMHLQR